MAFFMFSNCWTVPFIFMQTKFIVCPARGRTIMGENFQYLCCKFTKLEVGENIGEKNTKQMFLNFSWCILARAWKRKH